MNKCIKATR